MELYQKIKSLCVEKGITVSQMCDEIGMSRSNMSALKNGRISTLGQNALMKISEYFGIGVDELLGKKAPRNVLPIELKSFPVLGKIACGQPIYAEQNIEAYVPASSGIKADFCVIASGDSMVKAGIEDGDLVFIRIQDIVDDGQIAAVCIGDEATLKRWYYTPEENKLILVSENPAYKPMMFVGDELDEIRCLGLAVNILKTVK